jgi:hypothetical protein
VLDGQKLLIDICEEEKVGRYFSSAFVGDIRGMKVGQHDRMDITLQIFKYLESKKLRSVHMMCGAFIETWLEYSGVIDLGTNTVSYWGTGDETWDLTSYDDSAAYTVEAILDESTDGYLRCKCYDYKLPGTSAAVLVSKILVDLSRTGLTGIQSPLIGSALVIWQSCMNASLGKRPRSFVMEPSMISTNICRSRRRNIKAKAPGYIYLCKSLYHLWRLDSMDSIGGSN